MLGAITFILFVGLFGVLIVSSTIRSNNETLEYHDGWARILGVRTSDDERQEKRAKKDPYQAGFYQGEKTGLPATDEQVRKHYNMADDEIKRYQEGRAAGIEKAVGRT